jgi:hypothetical protein
MLLAPALVLFLLFRGTLADFFMSAVGFGLPLVVNNGFVLRRLCLGGLVVVVPTIVVRPATGGQDRGGQCDTEQGQTEISSKVHVFPFAHSL